MITDLKSPENDWGSYIEFRHTTDPQDRPAMRTHCPACDEHKSTFISITQEQAYWLIAELKKAFPERRLRAGDRRAKRID